MTFRDKILWLSPRKLSKKLALANILILCISMLGFAWYSASLQSQQKFNNDRQQIVVFTKNLAALTAKYLQRNEFDQLETKIYQLIRYPGVKSVLIINNATHYILSVKVRDNDMVYTETSPRMPVMPAPGDKLIQVHNGYVLFWQKVIINAEKNETGWLRLYYDTEPMEHVSSQIFKHSLSIAILAILLSLIALKRLLSRPMNELRRASEFAEYLDLAQGNQIEIYKSSQEIEQLLRALNRTSEKLFRQEELQRSNALLLDTIREIQSQFISETYIPNVFESLMSKVVQLSKSEFGFFGEVLLGDNNKPYLQMRTMSNLPMNRYSREYYNDFDIKNLKFHNMNNLIGAVIQTNKPMIANDVATDPRRGGLPAGHPIITAFLGLPVFSGDRVVGVIGLANRVKGYDQGIVAYLQPLLSTCSHMIEGYRNEKNRKQLQDELKRKNAKLQTILNSVSDGIVTVSHDGTISSVNTTAANMFTYNTDDMVGDDIFEYIAGLRYKGGKLYVNDEHVFIQSGNEKIKWRMEGRHKDGHGFPIEVSVSEYRHGNRHSYTITIRNLETDIGTYKIKENLITTFDKVLNDSLTEMQSSLTQLKGRVVGELSDSVDDLIHTVYDSTAHLIELVNNVKDVNRIESGEIELHIRQLDVGSFVDRVLSSNQDICRQYSISFQTAGEIEYSILGDEDRLLQVLRYLVSTAATFCTPGGALEFSTRPNKELLELSVVGYAQRANPEFLEYCESMFLNLYSESESSVRDRDYILYLCRAIIDHHGGKLGCDVKSERSVRLFVQLPVYGLIERASNM